MKIFLDLDGVVFDFVGGLEKLLRVDLSGLNQYSIGKYLGIPDSKIWRAIDEAGSDFWANLEPYPWKDELIEFLYSITDEIFITTSPSSHPSCSEGKHEAILTKMPGKLHRRFFIGPRKEQFARDETTVLIDDSDSKCEAFRKAGGRAIVFPRPWNSKKEFASDPMSYIKKELKSPDIHIFILEDDSTRILSFEQRFNESTLANFTFDNTDDVEEAKMLLKSKHYDMLFLDHDLGGQTYVDVFDDNTGSELARWLAANKADISFDGVILIHSFNPQGAEYMRRTLDPVFKQVEKTPAIWTKTTFNTIFK